MRRRRSRRQGVRGKPNYLWIASAGELALGPGNTVWDTLLMPSDWSGTVTEQGATLLRMVVQCYTDTRNNDQGGPHAQNAAIWMSDANIEGGSDTLDISNWNDYPDFFARHDRVLHTFRLEWAGTGMRAPGASLPVQFSQLPEPVMNLKTPRRLNPDDTVVLGYGGFYSLESTEVPMITWFCRSLVRVGLR